MKPELTKDLGQFMYTGMCTNTHTTLANTHIHSKTIIVCDEGESTHTHTDTLSRVQEKQYMSVRMAPML